MKNVSLPMDFLDNKVNTKKETTQEIDTTKIKYNSIILIHKYNIREYTIEVFNNGSIYVYNTINKQIIPSIQDIIEIINDTIYKLKVKSNEINEDINKYNNIRNLLNNVI